MESQTVTITGALQIVERHLAGQREYQYASLLKSAALYIADLEKQLEELKKEDDSDETSVAGEPDSEAPGTD